MLPTWLSSEWIVALRFLREGRLQTLFIITGVAIGVAVIVFMSALLSGLQANFIRRVLNAQAHVQLLPAQQVTRQLRGGPEAGPPKTWPKSAASALPAVQTPAIEGAIVQPPLQRLKSIDQWRAVAAQIQALPGVRVVAPVAAGSGLAVRGNASRGISLTGIDPALYFRIVDLGGGLPQRRDARPRRGADRQRRPDTLAAQRGRQAQRRPAAAPPTLPPAQPSRGSSRAPCRCRFSPLCRAASAAPWPAPGWPRCCGRPSGWRPRRWPQALLAAPA